MAAMKIRDRAIGPDQPPYVIAEVSCNHAGSEAVAMALIQVAKDAGAEAVKFQFYTPEGMVGGVQSGPDDDAADLKLMAEALAETDERIPWETVKARLIQSGPWAGQSMYDLYKSAQMPWEWGPRLKQQCHELGLAFIASAYDVDGLNWLMANCVPDALKVASFEATDTQFVEAMASKGLPLMVSLGMTTWEEQGAIHDAVWAGGVPDYLLLHCVSAYPTPSSAAHLSVFDDRDVKRINTEGVPVGFSDHTLGHAVACAAVAKGACVLEKHIQLHPSLKTADSHFSCTPSEFEAYVKNVREAWEACQPVVGDPEKDSRQFRRAPGGKRGSYVG